MKNTTITKTRRPNKDGCLYQRSDGLWVGMVSLGYDENGKQKRKAIYGKTRLEVGKRLSELTNRINSDNYVYNKDNTLSTIMKEWLLVFKKSQVTPRSFENNFCRFKNHIEPRIGGMKLEEITTMTVQRMLNDIQDLNLSLDYLKKTKQLLRQFFDYAIECKLIVDNPVAKVIVKTHEHKIYETTEYKAIPIEKRDLFIKCLEKHPFLKPLCFVMMFAGLRTGETLALQWKDINFNNKTINIEKAITTVPKFNSEGKVLSRKTVISDTKTVCSKRVVPMPEILITALKEYYNYQRQKTNGIDLTDKESFVFCNNNGNVRSYSGTKKILYTFLNSNNLNNYHIHFHTLRHTYSNTLFEAKQNPKVIQSLLGHKSVKTTITTYNSVDKSYFDKATDVFNTKYKQEEKIELNDEVKNNVLDNNKLANDELDSNELADDELDKQLKLLLKEKEERLKKLRLSI